MPPTEPRPLLPALLWLLLGVAAFVMAWATVALAFERVFAWLAVLAAADMVLLLGMARMPASALRATLALLATAAIIVLVNFGIAAGHMGEAMGMTPWRSALLLGPRHAWTIAQLANSRVDWVLYALALLVAAAVGFSARRRAPSAR